MRRLDMATLKEINRLAARLDWPLRPVFQDAERAKARAAFTGSIGQQLKAKGVLDGEGSLGLLFTSDKDDRRLRPTSEKRPLDVEALGPCWRRRASLLRVFLATNIVLHRWRC